MFQIDSVLKIFLIFLAKFSVDPKKKKKIRKGSNLHEPILFHVLDPVFFKMENSSPQQNKYMYLMKFSIFLLEHRERNADQCPNDNVHSKWKQSEIETPKTRKDQKKRGL